MEHYVWLLEKKGDRGLVGPFIGSLCFHGVLLSILASTTVFYPPTGNVEKFNFIWVNIDSIPGEPAASSSPSAKQEKPEPPNRYEAITPPESSAEDDIDSSLADDQSEPEVSMIAASKSLRKRLKAVALSVTESARKETINAQPGADELAEAKRLLQEKAEREKLAAEMARMQRLAAEKAAREQAELQRIAQEKAEREVAMALKLERERQARELAEQQRIAAEIAVRERLAAEQAAAEKAEAERLAAERAEAEQLVAEKAAREKAERERLAREKAARERLAAALAEEKRLASQRAELERLAALKAEQERIARSKASVTPAPSSISSESQVQAAKSAALPGERGNQLEQKRSRSVPAPSSAKKVKSDVSPEVSLMLATVYGDLKLVVAGTDQLKYRALFKAFPKHRRDRPMTKSESTREQKVVSLVLRTVDNSTEVIIKSTLEGIYVLFAEPDERESVTTNFSLKLYEATSRAKTKTLGRKTIEGKTIVAKILMPEGILWDDEEAFSGSIENSDSVTKFNAQTGLMWKEYR